MVNSTPYIPDLKGRGFTALTDKEGKNMAYLLARLKEASTWRGIALLLTAFGVQVAPDVQEAVISAGVAVAGAIGVFFPDSTKS